ncbi:hypothetical protein ACX3P1_15675 [Mesorhizobium sp. A623]
MDKRGVTARSITFGVVIPPDNRTPAEAYLHALSEAIQQSMGAGKLFGRDVLIRPLVGDTEVILDAAETGVAAVVGLVPSRQLTVESFVQRDVPVLFPLAPLAGNEDGGRVRSFLPSLDQTYETLLDEAIRRGARRIAVIDLGGGHPSKGLLRSRDDVEIKVTDFAAEDGWADAAVLIGTEEARVHSVLAALPSPTDLYAIAGQLPSLPAMARERGLPLVLANPYAALTREDSPDLLRRHARRAAALLKFTILASGHRNASRTSLVAAFDKSQFAEQDLDFMRFPLTGTDEVGFLSSK